MPSDSSQLVLPCKDCQRPLPESETVAYRLISGIFYGWCNDCFQKGRVWSRPPAKKAE
jgi:hypothetical protein